MIQFSPDAIVDIQRVREFLESNNPDASKRALGVIWTTLERLERFPDLGRGTEDPDIRQIIIRFGAAGYVIRYAHLPEKRDILVLRAWHGREIRA